MAVGTMSREDRAVLARAALARAEQRTGARSVLPLGGPAVTAQQAACRPGTRSPASRDCRRTSRRSPVALVLPHRPEAPVEQPTAGIITSERPPMAVPPPLAPILPEGLRRGGDHGGHRVDVAGAGPARARVRRRGVGGASSASRPSGCSPPPRPGSSLDRLAVVPRPGLEAPTVVAALLDGVDVVVVGPRGRADRRRPPPAVRARPRPRVGAAVDRRLARCGRGAHGRVGPVDRGRRGRGTAAHARDPAGPHRPGQRRGAARRST